MIEDCIAAVIAEIREAWPDLAEMSPDESAPASIIAALEEIAFPYSAKAAASRVTLHRKAWAGSPAIWIGGACSDLQKLIAAGMVERLPSGWHIPTNLFPES